MKLKQLPDTSSQALELVLARDILPTAYGSGKLRSVLTKEIREKAVFSARTTNALYLQKLRGVIERYIAGGYNNDLPQLRLELKQMLALLKYTPENGFPGDEKLGIPPAEPHSLQDLSSDKRIELILKTESKKARGAAQKARGLQAEALEIFPAYELVRYQSRRVPRGSAKNAGIGWQRRWFEVGGPINASGRLIALKTDPVWQALGSSENFDDAMDLDHPPFAYNSGMGWSAIGRSELDELGIEFSDQDAGIGERDDISDNLPANPVAKDVVSTKKLDADMEDGLMKRIQARRKNRSMRRESLLTRELKKAVAAGVTDLYVEGGDK